MQHMLDELVQVTLTNPASYMAVAIFACLIGYLARHAFTMLLGIAAVILVTSPFMRAGLSPVAQDALQVINTAMTVAFVSYALGALARTVKG